MNLHLLLIVIYFLSSPYMTLPLLPIVIYLFLIKSIHEFTSIANCNLFLIKSIHEFTSIANCNLFISYQVHT